MNWDFLEQRDGESFRDHWERVHARLRGADACATEAEWLECTDPEPMLDSLGGQVGDRKLRLFAVACCRRIWDLLTEENWRAAVEASERYADGRASGQDLSCSREAVVACLLPRPVVKAPPRGGDPGEHVRNLLLALDRPAPDQAPGRAAASAARPRLAAAWRHRARVRRGEEAPFFGPTERMPWEYAAEARADLAAGWPRWHVGRYEERRRQADLVRCLFGNPSRPSAFDPAWRTTGVLGLAQAVYDARRFADLPGLAARLEDAGCADAALLGHCRSPGPHARGCWVLDAVLGKTGAGAPAAGRPGGGRNAGGVRGWWRWLWPPSWFTPAGGAAPAPKRGRPRRRRG
jgi:hypothetical protein